MWGMVGPGPGPGGVRGRARSGYAAALMAHLVGETGQVGTLDLDEDIVNDAHAHLNEAGVEHVRVICSDGVLGWEETAPYDRAVLTVGATDIAPAGRQQLLPARALVL